MSLAASAQGGRSVAAMTENDGLRRYVEAATAFTQITRSRAEELVRELIKTGELERHRAQDWVEDLVKTSRDRSEALVDTVRGEVRQQLKELGFTNVDDLAKRWPTSWPGPRPRGARPRTGPEAGKVEEDEPEEGRARKNGPAKKAAAKKPARKKATGTKKAAPKKAGA